MRKRFALFALTAIFLSSCTGNLWGSYDAYLTDTPAPTATQTVFVDPATVTPTLSQPTDTPTPPTGDLSLTPELTETPSATSTASMTSVLYVSQSGDSLDAIAAHFEVGVDAISYTGQIPETGFLSPGTALVVQVARTEEPVSPSTKLLPDSEVIYSPSAVDFDVDAYVAAAGGKLASYREYLSITGWTSGSQVVQRIAYESSINPRLLLALLQYHGGWVEGQPFPDVDENLPLGYSDPLYHGVYQQMRLAIQDLAAGYYGWRRGILTDLTFVDGSTLRISPDLNAGTVAIQYYFASRMNYSDWQAAIDPETGFVALHEEMFGDPWLRDDAVKPLITSSMRQPDFSLPFEVGRLWSLTGGPHPAWEQESVYAALDFAPAMAVSGCVESTDWVVAIAPGLVVRSGGGYVILDLDGDGYEQTGWVVLYMHIATKDRIAAGTWVDAGTRIGHPSCEGGLATGTHLHIARKFNGEWIGAGGPLPFILSGWEAHYGVAAYKGTLTKADQTITASTTGTHEAQLTRQPGE